MLTNLLPAEWKQLLTEEINKPYFKELESFVCQQYATEKCFPAQENIFRALELCPPSRVKVVILGQDPYHNDNQANGLCFSVNENQALPPSLKNIFKELSEDLNIAQPSSGELEGWAKQGVLMINAVLSVRAHLPASHAKRGWEKFTDAIIEVVNKNREGVVYMLWGAYAQKKCRLVSPQKNLILQSVHPSPLSCYRGFFGCKHFSKANAYLPTPIEW